MSSSTFDFAKLTDLTGYVALVTGGGTGLGLMASKALATQGAKVYITGRRVDVLTDATKLQFKGEGKIIAIPMDVTNKDSIARAVETVSKNDGKLHILINNAGGVGVTVPFALDPSAPERKSTAAYGKGLFDSQSFEDWSDLFAKNTASIFFVTSAFLELLEAGAHDPRNTAGTASIINVTSVITAMNVGMFYSMYAPSKTAAAHLTRLFATDFALKGIPIRVNAMAPGVFATEATGSAEQMAEAAKTPLFAEHAIPLGRPGRDHELGAIAVYLASPASSYTNGQEIVFDGGWSAVNP